MAEIMRLEAMTYDKAKTDILGSLSHELRSPLHGVIAAADLLHDTTLDAFQCDVLHSMESCGRTLLDVMNHLLDYSKVNTFLRDEKGKRRSGRMTRSEKENSFRSNSLKLSSHVQLDVLTEESIDSVFAGHIFQKMSIAQLGKQDDGRNYDTKVIRRSDTLDAIESFGHQTGTASNVQLRLGHVSVFIDIDPSIPWDFRTQPGAIRRLVLNIFGNSLRYTERGFIIVALKQETTPAKHRQTTTNLKIIVADSGRGISPHFLQHNIFTPFAQEDRLSPGTGLGLSLVKQILKTFKGTVTIESRVGTGTCIQISLPMPKRIGETEVDPSFEGHKTALKGLRICLVGLDETLHSNSTSLPSLKPMSESDLMSSVCSEWLKMQVITLDDRDIRPDVVICGEDGLDQLVANVRQERGFAPIVVICRDAVTAHEYSTTFRPPGPRRILEYISQPVGPRKLAKVLVTALNRWIEVAKSELPASAVPDSPIDEARVLPSVLSKLQTSDLPDEPGGKSEGPSADTQQRDESTAEQVPPSAGEDSAPQSDTISRLSSPSNTDSDIGKTEFLLVDDNRINLQILASFMKKLEKPHRTAMNGFEAFKIFTAEPSRYSCILMDVSMPVMDGLEATRRIREIERTRKLAPTTIIALTGLASSSTQQEAFASGMDLFLTKPVKLKDLHTRLTERNL
ncbi:Uu.00g131940.m01.CDS01 [Anthostomella pinea]|uniref:histidine kinase n=1 Tax=Anthostomella pinea TaxID=933095 RepID=A0AAI8VJX8_9PEZI|nr:Uu.00g131940.m01.CDS01 [Anthostomella pinea]